MIEILTVKLMALGSLTVKTILPSSIPVIAMTEGIITENTGVPLTIVCAIGGACWYLQGRFTRIEDRLEELSTDLKRRPCQLDKCPMPDASKKDENK